jgi:hypothetical protein
VDAAPPQGEWTTPPADDPYLREQKALRGLAVDPNELGILSVTLTVDPVDPVCGPDGDHPVTYEYSQRETEVEFEFQPFFHCNAVYTARATVRSRTQETTVIERLFGVAIPPREPGGLSARYAEATVPPDDDGDGDEPPEPTDSTVPPAPGPDDPEPRREATGPPGVELSWLANSEIDLQGYAVQRAVSSTVFREIAFIEPTESPRFVDTDIRAGGGDHVYRVLAVRSGPDEDHPEIRSEPAEATVSLPGGDADGGAVAGTEGGNDSARRSTGGAGARSGTPGPRRATTRDTGFSRTLPFQGDGTAPPPAEAPEGEPPPHELEDGVIADFTDDDAGDLRAMLLPIAGGMALLVGAMQLRFLIRRASDLVPGHGAGPPGAY